MNYKTIFYTLGMVIGLEGLAMLCPLICGIIYVENEWYTFLICTVICVILSVILTFKKPDRKNIYAKEGFVIVSLSWIVMSIIGSLPFILSGAIKGFIPALFEIVSGFTTTGASVLKEVEPLPKCILFWRSFSHWIGGMGVLVLLVAVLPLSGGSNLHLLKAESTGPSVSKLVPRVKSSTTILYLIYIAMTVIEAILLLICGLNLFEALTLTFGTAGTGGFGILNSSIASYSPHVQWIITIFMILFGIDFTVYYFLIMRKFKAAIRSDEVRAYIGIILASIILITLNCYNLFDNIFDALRHISFQVGSLITTTGYSTVDYNVWPEFSKMILIFLMFAGACAGSTGGGVKVSRILILLKSVVKEIKVCAHPKSTHKSMLNGRPINHETVRAVNVFMVSYISIFLISLILISIDNLDFTTNATAVLATLNNIGPGLNIVGPAGNYSDYSNFSLLVLIFDMLAGRLEIFPMLILFSKYTWKK